MARCICGTTTGCHVRWGGDGKGYEFPSPHLRIPVEAPKTIVTIVIKVDDLPYTRGRGPLVQISVKSLGLIPQSEPGDVG